MNSMNFNFSSGSGGRTCKKNEEAGEQDYYNLLEVERDASFEEIKKAYRRLSMIHHPDKNGNNEESTIKFKQLASAYETLSNEDKRAMYDMGIRGNMRGGTMPFDININPFDIFNMMFGSHVGGQQHQVQHNNPFNFHDVGNFPGVSSFIKFGNGMPLSMSMPMPMPMPMGMGIHIIHPENIEHVHVSDIPGFRQQQEHQYDCEKNDIYITLEDAYNGIEKHSVKIREEELYIKIPPGVNDKEIIIVTTSKRRMVHIIVNIRPHELFKRNGLDLILEKDISLKESLCGLEFSIKHLNGKTFHLQHKDGTIMKDNVSKTIQRLGMKNVDGEIGAMIIIFKVVYPDKLTNDQIEKLSTIL